MINIFYKDIKTCKHTWQDKIDVFDYARLVTLSEVAAVVVSDVWPLFVNLLKVMAFLHSIWSQHTLLWFLWEWDTTKTNTTESSLRIRFVQDIFYFVKIFRFIKYIVHTKWKLCQWSSRELRKTKSYQHWTQSHQTTTTNKRKVTDHTLRPNVMEQSHVRY